MSATPVETRTPSGNGATRAVVRGQTSAEPAAATTGARRSALARQELIHRLHRIEGQVRGIERMIAEDRYCIEILTQISAASTALASLGLRILDDHVDHCVADALAAPDPDVARAKRRELVEAVERFTRAR